MRRLQWMRTGWRSTMAWHPQQQRQQLQLRRRQSQQRGGEPAQRLCRQAVLVRLSSCPPQWRLQEPALLLQGQQGPPSPPLPPSSSSSNSGSKVPSLWLPCGSSGQQVLVAAWPACERSWRKLSHDRMPVGGRAV